MAVIRIPTARLRKPSSFMLGADATEIGSRYMGAERAEEFGRRNTVPGELLVRITPEHVISGTDLAA